MEGKYSVRAAHKVCSLGYCCLRQNSKARPFMSNVVERLEPLLEGGGSDGDVVHVGGGLDYKIRHKLIGNSVHCRAILNPKCSPCRPDVQG